MAVYKKPAARSARRRIAITQDGMAAAAIAVASSSATYVFDYNSLESALLVSSMTVLLSGMVFQSAQFGESSVALDVLAIVIAGMLVLAVLSFVVVLGFETVRALKFAVIRSKALALELDMARVHMSRNAFADVPKRSAVVDRARRRTLAQLKQSDVQNEWKSNPLRATRQYDTGRSSSATAVMAASMDVSASHGASDGAVSGGTTARSRTAELVPCRITIAELTQSTMRSKWKANPLRGPSPLVESDASAPVRQPAVTSDISYTRTTLQRRMTSADMVRSSFSVGQRAWTQSPLRARAASPARTVG